jgi:hypothetical protein
MGHVSLWDDDIGADDHIGDGSFSITDMMQKPEHICRVTLTYKGKPAGTVDLKCKYCPD